MNDIESYKKFFLATTMALSVVRSVSRAVTGSCFVSEYEAMANIGKREADREHPSMELLKVILDGLIEMAERPKFPLGGIPNNGPEEIFKPGQRFKDGGLVISDPMVPTQRRS